MSNIDDTLAERGTRYGEFTDHAEVTQEIKRAMAIGQNWEYLPDDMRECLEMIAHKVGRILNGDLSYIDSWTDIIGYTRLVEKRLIDEQAEPKLKDIEAERSIGAFIQAMKDAIESSDEPCDDPACKACHPKDDEPSREAVMSSLDILVKAGVIKRAD